jgi:hypothetical protein
MMLSSRMTTRNGGPALCCSEGPPKSDVRVKKA